MIEVSHSTFGAGWLFSKRKGMTGLTSRSTGLFPRLLKKRAKTELPEYLRLSEMATDAKFLAIENEEHDRFGKHEYSVRHGFAPFSVARNRYRGVVPWDKTRVRLPVRDAEDNDYINASWVTIDTGARFGPDSLESSLPKTYIVTQGPTDDTVAHFWQMAYEYGGDPMVIVMLTGLVEPFRNHRMVKCARYWPTDPDVPLIVSRSGGFKHELSVHLVSKQVEPFYELRELTIVPTDPHAPTKTVHHFYYNTWADFDNPRAEADMVNFVQTVDALNADSNSPLFVHCSAGIGRSGTFVAIDAALTRGAWVDDDRDVVYEIARSMRDQRPGMVQKASQYRYIYEQVAKALKTRPKLEMRPKVSNKASDSGSEKEADKDASIVSP